MLNFKILNGKSLFFSKKHAQKTPLKNKKKSFWKKSLNVAQNQEQPSERASQVNQASQVIQENQAKLVSQPQTVNFFFFKKNMVKIKKNKKKCHFGKKSWKVAHNWEQASERAFQLNQTNQVCKAIQSKQVK